MTHWPTELDEWLRPALVVLAPGVCRCRPAAQMPADAALAPVTVLVVRDGGVAEPCECVDVVLSDRPTGTPAEVVLPDPDAALRALAAAVRDTPRAALALVALLRQTSLLPVQLGLAAESAVYSMLLAGPEFAAWRVGRPVRAAEAVGEPVVLTRVGDVLTITLDRADRRNAFSTAVRNGLLAAFDVVDADPSITEVDLRGSGPAFSSGGDLDEFGTATDLALAHLVRLRASVGARVHARRDRVVAHVQGACIGAGVEVPAFAGRVVAAPDAFFGLPEVAMGLVPGAGGTVSVVRRIGRHRTAYLALTGARLDARRALEWGLVDASES